MCLMPQLIEIAGWIQVVDLADIFIGRMRGVSRLGIGLRVDVGLKPLPVRRFFSVEIAYGSG